MARENTPDVMGGLLGGRKVSRRRGPSKPEGDSSSAETVSGQSPEETGATERAEKATRKNATFYLSASVQEELENLYIDLRRGGGPKASKSEIVEAALAEALEEVRKQGAQSPLMERLNN